MMNKETDTELLVCTTCRLADAPRAPQAAGQALFEAVEAVIALGRVSMLGLRLRGIACLAACSRSCTVALQAPGKASYVFGDLAPDDDCVHAALAVAQQHAASTDGQLAWGQRPERLRCGLVARLPSPAVKATAEPEA